MIDPKTGVRRRGFLRNIKIGELSLVGSPANPDAHISVFKRAGGGGECNCGEGDCPICNPAGMPGDKPGKGDKMSDDAKKVAELQAQIDSLKTSNAELVAKLQASDTAKSAAETKVVDLEKQAEVMKKDETFEGPGGVVVKKSDVGDTTFAILKAQQETIDLAKHEKIAETTFKSLPGEPAVKAKAVRAVASIKDEDARKALETMLTAGNAALAVQMTEKGQGGEKPGSDDPNMKLDELAKAYAAEKKITVAAAYDEVTKTAEGRKLYNAIVNKRAA